MMSTAQRQRAWIGSLLTAVGICGFGLVLANSVDAAPQVGAEAPDFELPALGGGKRRLSDLTKTGKSVVLVVLRGYPGYQCPLCSRQYGEYLNRADDFHQAGAQVVFVYPGAASSVNQKAQEFAGTKPRPPHVQLLVDSDLKFTSAYGLRWDAPNETAYPSTLVIDPQRKVTFARVSTSHGGRTSPDEVLRALTSK